MSGSLPLIELAKRRAAEAAFKDYIVPLLRVSSNSRSPTAIGIGSGSTIVHLIDHLSAFVQGAATNEGTAPFVCIPTSFQSRQLLVEHRLPVGDLDAHPEIAVTIDGADEVDASLNCIKGGGGCHVQEKIVAYNSKRFVIVADYRKDSSVLGEKWHKGVPLEVIPMALRPVQLHLRRLGATAVHLRMGEPSKAGPCISDNGNFLVDAQFGHIQDPASLDRKLKAIAGIVDTGLFVGMAERAYFGMDDGSVRVSDKLTETTSTKGG